MPAITAPPPRRGRRPARAACAGRAGPRTPAGRCGASARLQPLARTMLRDRIAMRGEATDVGVAKTLGLADAHHRRGVDVGETRCGRQNGKGLFHRVGDHQEVTACAAGREMSSMRAAISSGGVRKSPIITMRARAAAARRPGGNSSPLCRGGRAASASAKRSITLREATGRVRPDQPNAFAAAHQQVGRGEAEHDRRGRASAASPATDA